MRSASERAPLVAGGRRPGRGDGYRGYGDGLVEDGYDVAGWSDSGRGHRARTLERRWLAALIALLGVVLAVVGRRHGGRGTVDAFGGVGGGWAPSAPSERLPRSQSRKGVISKPRDGVRILGIGELTAKKVEIHAAGASKAAIAAVEKAGGKIVVPVAVAE